MAVTFNSVTLTYAKVSAGPLPTRDKEWSYPGADGVEVLPMGLGSRTISVHGTSTGTPSRSTLEGMMDNQRHSLSADGDTFANCRCISVEFPQKWKDGTSGGIHFTYVATFRQEVPD